MVDLGGAARPKFAGSGTLSVVEIHLSQDTPQEVIQQILALVVDSSEEQETPRGQPGIVDGKYRPMPAASSSSSANVLPRLIKLEIVSPHEFKTNKWSLGFGVRSFLFAAGIIYHIIGTPVATVEYIEKHRPYVQETKVNGSVEPLDEAIKAIRSVASSTLTLRITPQTGPEISKSEQLKRAEILAAEIAKLEGVQSAKSYEQLKKSDIHGLDPVVIAAEINAGAIIIAAIISLFVVLRKDRDKGNHQNFQIEVRDIHGENVWISINNDNEEDKLKELKKLIEDNAKKDKEE